VRLPAAAAVRPWLFRTGPFGHPVGVDVTDATFQADVIERSAEQPVVVDFWADWCGPCKLLTPVLEEETAKRSGVVLAKVDVDANPDVAAQYDVRGIPAVKAFRNGQVVSEFVGAQPRAAVESFLDELTKPPVVESLEDDEELAGALRANDYERAFEILLTRLDAADPERRDEVRRLMVELFGELGHEHPLTVQYRRRLATALY
jgi:putative thioredoxin